MSLIILPPVICYPYDSSFLCATGSPPKIYWALNCDWTAQDVVKIRAGGDQCGQLCRNNIVCSHFAWNNANGGTCYLKVKHFLEFSGDLNSEHLNRENI